MASSKANYFKLGVFSLTAIIILTATLIMYGAGTWGKESLYFETYIDESVEGLSVGSPVNYRGVQIGQVEKITFVPAVYDLDYTNITSSKFSTYVLVVMSANPQKVKNFNRKLFNLDNLIQEGLRLTLARQTLTGVARLELDYPSSPGPVPDILWEPDHPYIPASKSLLGNVTDDFQKLLHKLSEINIAALESNINNLITELTAKSSAVDTAAINTKLIRLLENADTAVTEVSTQTNELLAVLNSKTQKIDTEQINEHLLSLMQDSETAVQRFTQLNDNLILVSKNIDDFFQISEGSEKKNIYDISNRLDKILASLDSAIYQGGPDITALLESMQHTLNNINSFIAELKSNPGQLLYSNQPGKTEVYE
ncbi:paraquat-inducible protein B [Limihaloglobus sulfuriphilus]|uniref:Paraquat-inducible protein B n=1 Tax=Limihaloglobus sulfuriphilus TaxID=1851148 RepID=A0A1Q2MCN0_9BACT|nr:MlaD family protein [Limihaloglobus sulfuriphilus]AQQ70057.1 paraquat-inducible protein B [Limihaloglobus sulfuriphilus]